MSQDKAIVSEVINKELQKWAVQFVIKRRNDAQALSKATGEGANSFKSPTVKQAGGNETAMAIFEFADYLRYFDMRRVQWGKVANIDALKDWIEKKGVNQFIPKFQQKYGYIPKSNQTLINKLAWGIGISFKTNGKWSSKRKRWYNKGKEVSINVLYGRLLDQLAKESLDNLKKSMQNGN